MKNLLLSAILVIATLFASAQTYRAYETPQGKGYLSKSKDGKCVSVEYNGQEGTVQPEISFSNSGFSKEGDSIKDRTTNHLILYDKDYTLYNKDYHLGKLNANTFTISKKQRNVHQKKNLNTTIVPVTLHFDTIPMMIYIYNSDTTIHLLYMGSTTVNCELPAGVYDIFSLFAVPVPGLDYPVLAHVFYENVQIITTFDTTVYSTDAKNKVELATYNESGLLLTDDHLVARTDNYSIMFPENFREFMIGVSSEILNPIHYILVSNISNRYRIFTNRTLYSNEKKVYCLKNDMSEGLTKDTLLSNNYQNFVELRQHFQLSPEAKDTCWFVIDQLMCYLGGPIWGMNNAQEYIPYFRGDSVKIFLDNGVSNHTPNGVDFFVRPVLWEDHPNLNDPRLSRNQILSSWLILNEDRDIINIGLYYYLFEMPLQIINMFPFNTFSYNLGSSDVSSTLGAEAPITYCQNFNNIAGFMPNAIFSYYYSMGQYNETRRMDNRYSLLNIKHNGEVVYNDTLSKFTEPLQMNAPAMVEENITNENFMLAGMPGINQTKLTFDQHNTDCDPPTLSSLRIVNEEGHISNTLKNNETATLLFAAGDYRLTEDMWMYYKEGTTASFSYKNYISDNWINSPLTEIPDSFDSLYGKVYTASLSGILSQVTDSEYVDLKIELTDSTGNTMVQTWHPAFFVIKSGVGISETTLQNKANLNIYPNPVNNSSIISFTLPGSSNVKLSVYNISGQLINPLLDKKMDKGNHQINWTATDNSGKRLNSGIYLLKLETGNTVETTKVVVY